MTGEMRGIFLALAALFSFLAAYLVLYEVNAAAMFHDHYWGGISTAVCIAGTLIFGAIAAFGE